MPDEDKELEEKLYDDKAAEEKAAEEKAAEEKAAADKTAEEKAAADKAAEEEKNKEGKEQKKVVPEKYELKLPEGSQLDQAHVDKTAAFAKKQGLSNEEAQGLLDRDSELLASHAAAQQETLEKVTGGWLEDAKVDPEIGGEAFPKNAELAKRVVDRYGSDELKKGLNDTGFGNHPELVKMFVKIGNAMGEDQLVIPGKSNAAEEKDMADVFYGSDKKD